jgi:hypothetical protein
VNANTEQLRATFPDIVAIVDTARLHQSHAVRCCTGHLLDCWDAEARQSGPKYLISIAKEGRSMMMWKGSK